MEQALGVSIRERVQLVRARIDAAARRSGRTADDVRLVAVSKTQPLIVIQEAYQAGLRHFGENRAEEASTKFGSGSGIGPDAVLHMIGHVQSRKTEDVARLFGIVHSVDRLKIAQRLSTSAERFHKALEVLVEVNLGGEESKYGYDLSDWPGANTQLDSLSSDIEAILVLPSIRLTGIMTVAPYTVEPETVRPVFARMRQLQDTLASRFGAKAMHHLSMGMSGDFETAIEEGATIVRIGTAIFGERHYPPTP